MLHDDLCPDSPASKCRAGGAWAAFAFSDLLLESRDESLVLGARKIDPWRGWTILRLDSTGRLLWIGRPVVHFQLGVAPDLGRGSVQVAPQVPDGQSTIAGTNIRLGDGSIDVAATRTPTAMTTTVTRHLTVALTIGAVLPTGKTVTGVTLNGAPVAYTLVPTSRGQEVRVAAGSGSAAAHLVVNMA